MIKHTNHCLLTLWSHKPEVQDKYEMSIEKTVFPDEKQQNAASPKPAVPCGFYPLKVLLLWLPNAY